MAGVCSKPYIFGIGELHHAAHFVLALDGAPDMWMRRHANTHGNRLTPDLIERVGEPLELIVAGPTGGTLPHIAFPERRFERLQKVAREGDVIRNRFRRL